MKLVLFGDFNMNLAIAAVIAASVGAVSWAVWRRDRGQPRAMKRFARDLVEHPEYHEEVDQEHMEFVRSLDEAEAAPPPQSTAFPRLIDDLLAPDKRRYRVAEIRLGKVAAEAEAVLLAALDDSRANRVRDESDVRNSAPAERVVELLASIPSRNLGERIGHLTDHSDWRVHGLAIKARVALGRASDLPFVLGKLSEQSDHAQEGVELAIVQCWAEPDFVEGIHEWARKTTLDDSLPFSFWAVEWYAAHGGPEAIENLKSPRILSVSNNRTIHAALEQLNRHGVRIEASLVRPLLDKSLSDPENWPWNCVFRPALGALAVSDPDEATRLAEAHLDHPESPYHRDAIDFLRDAAGLPMPYAIEPPESMTLTDDEQKLVEALAICSPVFGEIRNGGMSQYFFNSTGSNWPQHVTALRAIGFEQGAVAVEEAARLIHPNGASLNRNERIAQYAALSERKEKRLDKLSELFYSDAPRLKYMFRHRELFARIHKARLASGME